jgi:hypothetical protein
MPGADVVASWGAALRTSIAGSQDESRCSAIHKQRPYRVRSGAAAESGNCEFRFGADDEIVELGGICETALGEMFGASTFALEFF